MNPSASRGRIIVVHGSMFGGKTEYLIARLREAQDRGRRVRAFKHAIDDRYAPDSLVTHNGDRFDALRLVGAGDLVEQCADVDVAGVDEGQFFGPLLAKAALELRARGTSLVVAGITNDAWGRPFEPIPQLVSLADEVVLRRAPCRVCGVPAPYTQRMTPVDTLHMVGGLDDYQPRCPEHFTPLNAEPETRS